MPRKRPGRAQAIDTLTDAHRRSTEITHRLEQALRELRVPLTADVLDRIEQHVCFVHEQVTKTRNAAMRALTYLEREHERPEPTPTLDPRDVYRDEREASRQRNAGKEAERLATIQRAIANADAEALVQRRGGRPRKHGPGITVGRRDPLDLLRESRPGGVS